MFEIFLGSSLSRSSTYVQFNYESYTNLICPKLHVSYDKQGLCRRQSALPEYSHRYTNTLNYTAA